jgi:hypothetical protein
MSEAFSIYTGIFILYWIATILLIVFGRWSARNLKFLEIMRLWVKPLFWMNFLYFAVAEVAFSALYWIGAFAMKVTGFMAPMNALFRAVKPATGADPMFYTWLFISVIIFLIIMTPYIFVHLRLTSFFKKVVLKMLAVEFRATNEKLVNHSPNILLPTFFVQSIVGLKDGAREWIESCSDGDNKFNVDTVNADHMHWEMSNYSMDFWEFQINFNLEIPGKDTDGKLSYTTDTKICFDGLTIRIEDVFSQHLPQGIFKIVDGELKEGHRKENDQGLFIGIIDASLTGGGMHSTDEDSGLDNYPGSMSELSLGTRHNIRYIGVDGKSLFILIPTGLDSTMFNFNMHIPAKESVALFQEDLSVVKSGVDVISAIVSSVEAFHTESEVDS